MRTDYDVTSATDIYMSLGFCKNSKKLFITT